MLQCFSLSFTVDWDKVVETELKDDAAKSEDALNEVFQTIYSQGSDEVKKAMNKSFVSIFGNYHKYYSHINECNILIIIIIFTVDFVCKHLVI